MGQERKGLGRKAGRRKAAVPLRRREAKSKTRSQSESRTVRASPDKSQKAEIARLASELKEALAQQSASSDVLKVINSSPGNLAAVFEAIVDKALQICDARFGGLWIVDGELGRPAATRNVPKAYGEFLARQALPHAEAFGRGIALKPFNHVADLARTESYRRRLPLTVASVELGGIRSYLAVPLRDGGALTGVLSVYRKEVRPFSERQVALLQGFAVQAEIAMKNARLLKETQEGLERQTATSDILKVIAGSPSNVQPVFETMLEKAISRCGAKFGTLFLYDGKGFTLAADRNLPRDYVKAVRGRSFSPEANVGFRFLVERKSTLHIPDIFADAAYARGEALRKAAVELGGVRSLVAVPLLKNGELIGNFSVYRKDPGGFGENQIALLENFANQAVIAIENARLFNETREALERQTATAEVLRIISSSPRSLEPVFKAMLGNAMRICDAKFGHVLLYDGERFHATHLHDVPQSYRAFWDKHGPIHARPNSALGRLARTKQVVHIPDLKLESLYVEREPLRIVTVDEAGARSFLAVPMLKENGLIGAIVIYRQEVRPFAEKQIELVKNFADQAVIAIENVRLFEEVQAKTSDLEQSLQHQTAAAEILQVISNSPGQLGPVFAAVIEKATRLCDAGFGTLFRFEGDAFYFAADIGTPPALADYVRRPGPFQGPPGGMVNRIHRTKQLQHSHDYAAEANPGLAATLGGARSTLGVPILKDDALVGAIVIYRQEVRPFSEREIALVRSFASQAAIAIENARLFNETRRALERQTATAEILQVIASSPSDVQPVFDAIATRANSLIGGFSSTVFHFVDGVAHLRAFTPTTVEADEVLKSTFPRPVADFPPFQMAQAGKVTQIPDTEVLTNEIKDIARARGYRSMLFAPLMNRDVSIGFIAVTRVQPGNFAEHHVQLLQTFADQAVIAIENARLFDEVQARTRDLTESLQQQTATADVLKVISRSAFNLQTVLDTLVESATRLCDAQDALIFLPSDNVYRAAARYGFTPEYHQYIGSNPINIDRGSVVGRTVIDKQLVHISDVLIDPEYTRFDAQRIAGYRAVLGAPLLREGNVVGVIFLTRTRAEPFTEKQIELVKTFADQAIIAIENSRLFDEVQAKTGDLEESLEQQTATAEVLRVISRSAFDVQTVLATLTDSAARLCDAESSHIYLVEGNVAKLAVCSGFSKEYEELLRRTPLTPGRGTLIGRTLQEGGVVHLPDAVADKEYRWQEAQQLGHFRTMLGIPMLRDGVATGVMAVTRSQVRPFTDKQIALLQTFADQAVIAIENARLFDEVQAKTRDLEESLQQQTATAEVLKVISSSSGDLEPVFESILANATRICDAKFGILFLSEGDVVRVVATHGVTEEYAEARRREPIIVPGEGTTLHIASSTRRPVQIADIRAEPAYLNDPRRFAILDLAGARTIMGVPIVMDDKLVGIINIYRTEVRPFTDKQVELVKNFAAQAVIAIENSRLLNELRESLQQQTATADVLKLISRSTFDLQAVLHALVETAAQLCDADKGTITRQKDGLFYRAESCGFSDDFMNYVRGVPVVVDRHTATGRALLEGVVVHIPDVQADPDYSFSQGQQLGDYRALLGVPMLREGVPIGVITLTRTEPRAFTDKQIELATTFADQAAIAIQNVRLFDEVQARTQELSRSLENLRAAQDRLVQTEKLASLGQLTAGIAHEIKNPLNFVNNFSALSAELVDEMDEALVDANLDSRRREAFDEIRRLLKSNLEKVVQHGKRADSIVKNMLLHSRSGSGERRPVEINAIIDESLNLAYHGARAEKQGFNITLERDFDPEAGIADIYPQEITRVFLNLISNGFYAATKHATQAGNGFEPRLKAATKSLGDTVEIRIRDNGTGIPSDIREKIFNPFFTTKPAGEGTGLGLSMSHDIVVKQHGGTIDIATEPGAFTEFIITLPRTMIQPGAGEQKN